MAKNWIKKAIRHPGAVKNEAKRRGVSTAQEAKREAHSSNPHVRARGLLAERFERGDLSR
jgi:hypothetical protein